MDDAEARKGISDVLAEDDGRLEHMYRSHMTVHISTRFVAYLIALTVLLISITFASLAIARNMPSAGLGDGDDHNNKPRTGQVVTVALVTGAWSPDGDDHNCTPPTCPK